MTNEWLNQSFSDLDSYSADGWNSWGSVIPCLHEMRNARCDILDFMDIPEIIPIHNTFSYIVLIDSFKAMFQHSRVKIW